VALLRSFGRADANGNVRGLSEKQKEFLVALALWKIDRLLREPFRYRSGCHLERISLRSGERDIVLAANIGESIKAAAFRSQDDQAPIVTDIYWPHDELYREGKDDDAPSSPSDDAAESEGDDGENP
jgi:CRISPR-associated protein Csb1